MLCRNCKNSIILQGIEEHRLEQREKERMFARSILRHNSSSIYAYKRVNNDQISTKTSQISTSILPSNLYPVITHESSDQPSKAITTLFFCALPFLDIHLQTQSNAFIVGKIAKKQNKNVQTDIQQSECLCNFQQQSSLQFYNLNLTISMVFVEYITKISIQVRSCFSQNLQFLHICGMQLKDPLKNRQVSTSAPPLALSLKFQQLFQKDAVHYNLLKKFYKREGKLAKPLYMELIRRTKIYLQKEPNIVRINDPVTIVGDIHGQYYDLMTLIDQDVGGSFNDTKYLFLGDYVDRGYFGIEVIGLLMAIKIEHPYTVFLLRGNHQCRQMATSFNFQAECLEKYDQEVFQALMDLFDTFPLAAIVNNKFFCIHGGVSTAVSTLAEIQKINRFMEIPKLGGYCDLMWADPVDTDDGKQVEVVTFNSTRGCSYFFGVQMAQKFLKENSLQSIIRAHQVQNEGFKPYFWGGKKEFPTVITIFSAPNYCDYYGNKGAILKFTNNHFDVQQIEQVSHPYVLPDFQDLFKWSFPFLSQNVLQLWNYLYRPRQSFDQSEAVPLFLIGKHKVLETMLGNLQLVTNQYLQKIKNQTPIPTKHLSVEGSQQKNFKQKAEQQAQRQKQMEKELLETSPSIGIRRIPAAQVQAAIENKIEFHRRKTLDVENEKRPTDHTFFQLLLPTEAQKVQGEQGKNEEAVLPNKA